MVALFTALASVAAGRDRNRTMGVRDVSALVREADRLRVAYLDAINRGDLEAALQLGVAQLVPVSEDLADADPKYYNPFGMTLMNLATICERLQRQVSGFYFIQRAFRVAVLLDILDLPMHDTLASSVCGRTDAFAVRIASGILFRADISAPESQMMVPAVSLVSETIEAMRRLDEFRAARRLRVAVTRLRALWDGPAVDLADPESRCMVWLARYAHARGEHALAVAELRHALDLWTGLLDSGARYWSTELGDTWTVAVEVLRSLSLQESATALGRAIEQAVTRHGVLGLSGLAEVLDLREHYRAALAGLPSA
jgi:hypothetical protein